MLSKMVLTSSLFSNKGNVKRFLSNFCFVSILASTLSLASHENSWAVSLVQSTFDSDLEGWTAAGGNLSFINTGGNPGGFLALEDSTDTFMTVFAPADYHGNLSGFLGGTLSFDASNLNGAPADLVSSPLFGTVTISGSDGTASRLLGGTGQPPEDGQWVTYSADLEPSLWSGDLTLALGNVSEISVVLESNEIVPAEFNGFDNFSIEGRGNGNGEKVPEPATTLGLLALGFLGAASTLKVKQKA